VIENFLCTRLILNTRRKWFWFKTSLSRKKLKLKLKKMSIIRKNKYFKNFKKIPNKKKMILKIREEILQSR
jgi:flagellar biosynthesis protein FlhB